MLTPKQEKFAGNVASGMSYADSYRDAYNAEKCTNDTIYSKASELMSDGRITARVDELRELVKEKVLYSVEAAFKDLNEIKDW